MLQCGVEADVAENPSMPTHVVVMRGVVVVGRRLCEETCLKCCYLTEGIESLALSGMCSIYISADLRDILFPKLWCFCFLSLAW